MFLSEARRTGAASPDGPGKERPDHDVYPGSQDLPCCPLGIPVAGIGDDEFDVIAPEVEQR